jgi:hypothetical protein
MEIERLEVEIKNLAERVRKREARTEGTAGRSTRSRAAQGPSHPHPAEDPAIPEQPSDWSTIESIEFRSVESFERDLEGFDGPERRRVIDAINAKSPL